jgi:DNA helicase HerA-like ATPase
MSKTKAIGTVSATEKNPNTCDEFTFWLGNDVKISPFDIVKVENKISGQTSTTYGMVEEIYHITDSPGHISNYVSSDFGVIGAESFTKKLSLTYAKASVIDNNNENYMPVPDGSIVYPADAEDIKNALGLLKEDDKKAIPAGLLKTSNGVSVPIMFNSDFVLGSEGAHLNISGISGLATKTSYAMFMLKAIQERTDDTAIIILNVKGDDLLRIDREGNLSADRRNQWKAFNIKCEPFKNVRYFYPYMRMRGTDNVCSNTALDPSVLQEQFAAGIAKNYIYTCSEDKSKIELLMSNIDDPNWTLESIFNFIETSTEFDDDDMNWDSFKSKVKEYANGKKAKSGDDKSQILVQSWKRFSRLIATSIQNDIFQNSQSGDPNRAQVHLSKEVSKINTGEVFVIDIAKLNEQLQCMVFGDVIKTVYDLKHGEYADERDAASIPKKIVIFVDELNKYAPKESPKNSPILNYLLEITERGRSEGIILFSAEQFRSAVHDRIKGNCSTNIYGRTNAIEISKPDYRYIPKVYSNMMTRLDKGDLIIEHPVFKTLLKVSFPYPPYELPNK